MNDFGQVTDALNKGFASLSNEFTSVWLPIQLGAILLAAVLGALAGKLIRSRATPAEIVMGWPAYLRLLVRLLLDNIGTIIFALLLTVAQTVMLTMTWPSRSYLLGVAASLATAWVVIALVAGLIRNAFVYRLVAIFAWTIAALSILGLLGPTMVALDSVGLTIGGLRVTPLLAIKTTVLMLVALWLASATSDFLERRLQHTADLTPSIQVLMGKLIRMMLITFAILIALSTAGIDFTALAFFSGAVGLGLGFGLQKVVSNLVSGIILLADKSIKPGDIISIGDQFGWVTNMGARCTSVDTRDGREILIPNEDFVTQHVINWSYSNYRMLLKANFGVSYDCDPHHVRAVAIAAAASVPRVLTDPAPNCYFEAFGDSSLDFSLRYWIDDPNNGVINVRGPVMLALWDAFKREGINIPYPIRDVRIRTAAGEIEVAAKKAPLPE